MSADVTGLEKSIYEQKLARYLWGVFVVTTVLFVIGKFIGYIDFLTWWWVIAPFAIGLFGSIVNYLDWVPNTRILLYTVYLIYGTLRFAILRIILWMPIFAAFFNCYCILKKYGLGPMNIVLAIAAGVLTYFIVIIFSGGSPGMPK